MNTARSRQAFIADVAAYLRLFVRGELGPREIDRLVSFSTVIARHKLRGRLQAAAWAEGVPVEEMALSIIGGLFGGDGPESGLAAALRDDLEADDISLFLHFQGVVTRYAAQELFHRWNQNDPASARLWRSVHRAVQHDPHITCFPAGKPEWTAPAADPDLPADLVPLGYADVKNIVGRVYDSRISIGDLVVTVVAEATRTSNGRPALRIEDVFAAVREVIADTSEIELSARLTTIPTDPFLAIAARKAAEQVLADMIVTLKKYESSGKLGPETIGYFNGALTDIIADCADGGPAQSYYQYVCAHWPDLTLDDYRRDFRAKFEYLAEKVRDGFFSHLRDYFGEKSQQTGHDVTT